MTDANEIPDEIREKYGDDVEMGTREDALIDDEERRIWIEHEDKLYWFEIQEITWERKTDILDDALDRDQSTGDVNLSLKDYYRQVMEETIVDTSIDGSLPIFLKGMAPEFGNKLEEYMPQPGTDIPDEEEGNSEQSSEGEQ